MCVHMSLFTRACVSNDALECARKEHTYAHLYQLYVHMCVHMNLFTQACVSNDALECVEKET